MVHSATGSTVITNDSRRLGKCGSWRTRFLEDGANIDLLFRQHRRHPRDVPQTCQVNPPVDPKLFDKPRATAAAPQ